MTKKVKIKKRIFGFLTLAVVFASVLFPVFAFAADVSKIYQPIGRSVVLENFPYSFDDAPNNFGFYFCLTTMNNDGTDYSARLFQVHTENSSLKFRIEIFPDVAYVYVRHTGSVTGKCNIVGCGQAGSLQDFIHLDSVPPSSSWMLITSYDFPLYKGYNQHGFYCSPSVLVEFVFDNSTVWANQHWTWIKQVGASSSLIDAPILTDIYNEVHQLGVGVNHIEGYQAGLFNKLTATDSATHQTGILDEILDELKGSDFTDDFDSVTDKESALLEKFDTSVPQQLGSIDEQIDDNVNLSAVSLVWNTTESLLHSNYYVWFLFTAAAVCIGLKIILNP